MHFGDKRGDWHDLQAELVEDLLKHQDGTRAAQDGERLAGKQRVGHARQRRPKQGLDGTLGTQRRGGAEGGGRTEHTGGGGRRREETEGAETEGRGGRARRQSFGLTCSIVHNG